MKMRVTLGFAAVTIWLLLAPLGARSETKELKTGAFQIVQEVVLPASPEAVYDAATGDISGWWDHHVSDHPKKLYIEAKPGGGFWEIFDDSGDGVLHATVIYAERGKRLRFTGPLGLSGQAVDMVTTYDFLPDPAGTKLRVTCNVSGQIDEGLDKILDSVWHHFIVERLKPYIESGAYKKKPR
ncbi:MAG TPA: SRPBCC domain-containing protein [Candidatus Acidoferrales bacterium]|nr:SRPBCC domain-containing protein [Candidatus Acidoferrales bacterium]